MINFQYLDQFVLNNLVQLPVKSMDVLASSRNFPADQILLSCTSVMAEILQTNSLITSYLIKGI